MRRAPGPIASGALLFLAAIAVGVVLARRSRGRAAGESASTAPAPVVRSERARRFRHTLPRLLPLAIVTGLAALRLAPGPRPVADVKWLDEGASRAFAEERWETAAEYARHAIDILAAEDLRRNELLCLRGEALLRAGHPRIAVQAFAPVIEAGSGPYRPQALYSGALAREAAGDSEGAAAWRLALRHEHPKTPWAERLGS